MDEERPTDGALLHRKHIFWAVGAVAIAIFVLSFLFGDEIAKGFHFLIRLQEHKEKFRTWIHSFGALGPLVFIAVQIGQVVFSPIPGELTGFLGGYIYGVGLATIYSTIGLTVGSYIAFALGRWLGRPFVERLITRKVLDKFDFLVSHSGAWFALIFFSIPGFPKDYMCYLLGLSPLRTRTFLLVAAVGRIPGTFILGLQGANLYAEEYGLFFTLILVMLIGAIVLAYAREPLRLWMRGRTSQKKRKGEAGEFP